MSRGLDFPWSLALAALAVAVTSAVLRAPHGLAATWLTADAGSLGAGQLWRAFTGPLVHATWAHLARDLAVILFVGIAYEQPLRRLWPGLLLAGLGVPTIAVVAAGAGGYLGLSGLGHALIAAVLVYELQARPRAGLVGLAAAGFLAKVGYEVIAAAPLFPMSLGSGVSQSPLAHATGVLAGAAVCLLGPARARRCA